MIQSDHDLLHDGDLTQMAVPSELGVNMWSSEALDDAIDNGKSK